MTAKLLNFIKSGPPAPRVVLLPDQRFFVRLVPVADAATATDVAAQVELALETLSPFPPAQLYHGYFWMPGAPQALIFASYRKRFTPEQAVEWKQAELVIPAFAAFLGVEHEPATTLLFPSAEGLTAIHWDSGPVPTAVLTRTLTPDATDIERTQAHDELMRATGGTRAVIDLTAAPEIAASSDEKILLFRAGEYTCRLPLNQTAALDVRDKTELVALRRSRSHGIILWRVLAGCAAALVLLGIGELGVVAGRAFWLKAQKLRIATQEPLVVKVKTADALANQIEELSTKRLLPMEMLIAIGDAKMRGGILFTRVTANPAIGLYSLQIDAQTQNAAEPEAYRLALEKLSSVAKADIPKPRTVGGMTTFTIFITFKPDAIKPAAQS